MKSDYWLAEVCPYYGYPFKLLDGPHSEPHCNGMKVAMQSYTHRYPEKDFMVVEVKPIVRVITRE